MASASARRYLYQERNKNVPYVPFAGDRPPAPLLSSPSPPGTASAATAPGGTSIKALPGGGFPGLRLLGRLELLAPR